MFYRQKRVLISLAHEPKYMKKALTVLSYLLYKWKDKGKIQKLKFKVSTYSVDIN